MNILILSWRGPGHPSAGGAEQATMMHARGWVRAGHKVILFTSSYMTAKPDEIIDDISIIRRGDQYFGVKIHAFFWYISGNHPKFDLVIDEFHGIPFFTPLYVNTKVIGFIHEVAQKVWSLNSWPMPFRLIPAIFGKFGEPLVFKLFYRRIPFMTVSRSTKSDLHNFGIRNVTVIENGISLLKKMPSSRKSKRFIVIFLSALARDKGVEDAMEAFNIMKKKVPNSEFWVVGKGGVGYTDYLHKICPQAKFFGFVSENKKFELLAKSHLLLFPSFHEGWGLVILEAASVGTPTVAYNVSGVRDAIRNNQTGILVNEKSPYALATACVNIRNDRKKYHNMSQSAKSWSKSFTWNISVSKSLALLRKITI